MARPRLERPNYRLAPMPSGRFGIFWTEGGRTRRVSTRTADRRRADAELVRFVAGLLSNPPPDAPTLGAILDGYLAERSGRVASHVTLAFSAKPLKALLGDLAPAHLSQGQINDYARRRALMGRKPGTIIRELVTLRAALNWAARERWIASAPAFRMPVTAPAPSGRWLTRTEARKLIAAATAPHLKLFVRLALGTAARAGALLELEWSRIDFERGLIDLGPGRGRKRRAVVPVNPKLAAALRRAAKARTTDRVIEYGGRPVASVKKAFRAAAARAGLAGASPHVLRHTAATWMVMAGVPLAQIARFLGDSEATVERVYGKHAPGYLRRAARATAI